ncbi:MAG: PDZ domain-containing protein [Phycisphaerales bacterium]
MLRWPDVSKTHIVFSYANDLWIVPKAGGAAQPLSTAPGQERLPRFSPDGRTVAFVGNYEGNWDLYTLPINGGSATRVTYHPSPETLADWTPDGKLLYLTNGFAGLARQTQLWTIGATGGLPEKLPVPYGGFGSISPDGEWLAYTPHSTDTRTWKRYRGGMATDVWLFNLKNNTSKKITDWEGTDTIPMWVPGGKGDKVYYISDAGPEHRLNVWSYTVSSGERAQVTKFADDDVKWPSIGPGDNGEGEIVFQLGSQLRLLNLKSGESKVVNVTVPGDKPAVRARQVDAARNVTGASLSPTGKRVVVEARGDVWTLPGKEGVTRNLTHTDGNYERSPVYSPDGKSIAYFSDATGEYELYIRPSDATPAEKKAAAEAAGDSKKADEAEKEEAKEAKKPSTPSRALPNTAKKLTNLGPGFRFGLQFSPDSKWLTFTDQAGRLYLLNVETQAISTVDQDPLSSALVPSWSHDSNWLAYGRGDEGNSQSAIWLYNVKTDVKTRVTDPMFSSYQPCFDRAGDWLYFASNRSISRPVYSDLDSSFAYVDTSLLYAVPLRADVKNPFLPKADEESVKEEKKADDKGSSPKNDKKPTPPGDDKKPSPPEDKKPDEPKKEDKSTERKLGDDAKPAAAQPEDKKDEPKKDEKKDDKKKEKAPLKIDLDGFEARAIQLPLGSGLFGGMTVADGGKLVYVRRAKIRDDEGPGGAGASIKLYDINADAKDRKEETIGDGGGFDISADGKKLLLMRGGASMAICDVSPGAAAKAASVPTGDMKTSIDPRDEWRQIILDTHRIYRDYFYEPTMHGVNWDKVRDHYLKMVDDAVTREDIAYIQAEMVSELNIGHAYISSPGDVENAPQNAAVGLLGCDYELVKGDGLGGGRYRIKHIVRGGQWDADAVGPLAQPGVDVKEGDYLLAVNGVEVDAKKDPFAAFLNTSGKTTTITVSSSPALDEHARDVLVRPIGSETDLRYRQYIEGKRAYVAKKTDGAVGYVYVPNTGVDGQSDLWRQFYGQRNKPALIIDERWNGGGQIPNRFIELLNRPVTNYWAKRDGVDWVWPPDSHYGAGGGGNQCILINGLAGSGGDMFPWLFKHHKLGPAIGTRTWGGLVGISGNPGLIDGGVITVPTFGFYKTDGNWGIEGHGTDPDIEVLDDPAKMLDGGDPQLDRAIEEMLKANKENPHPRPKRPASPDRSGMGSDPKWR